MAIRAIDPNFRLPSAEKPSPTAEVALVPAGSTSVDPMEVEPAKPARKSRIRLLSDVEAEDRAKRLTRTPVEPASPSAKRQHHKVDRTTDNWDENGNYIVGKGRPSKAHQWKPGQSGNPSGPKPKPKLTPQQLFDQELMAEFNIKKNGEDVAVNLGQFVISMLKKTAADGTVKAQQVLLDLYREGLRRMHSEEAGPEADAREREIIGYWLEELKLPANPVVRKARISTDGSGEAA